MSKSLKLNQESKKIKTEINVSKDDARDFDERFKTAQAKIKEAQDNMKKV